MSYESTVHFSSPSECQPGFIKNGYHCEPCPAGHYYDEDTNGCQSCPTGSTTDVSFSEPPAFNAGQCSKFHEPYIKIK